MDLKNEKGQLNNIYDLDGKVPLIIALPIGLQHVLAMFLANVFPMILICGVARLNGQVLSSDTEITLIQNCMLASGLASLVQIFGLWRVGSKLPIIMGISFTFVSVAMTIVIHDYNYLLGAVIIGGLIEGTLGLVYKYWKKLTPPIVCACVVCATGITLFSIGTNSFGGGDVAMSDFGSLNYWIMGGVTLIMLIFWQCRFKGILRAMSPLVALFAGYITAICIGEVDLTNIFSRGIISIPKILPTGLPKFEISSIISMGIIFMVSATETIGDTGAICLGAFNRDVTEKEISGALACDGYMSSVSGCVGCLPITSFSQNIGLVTMTKVVNRFVVGIGAAILIIVSFFPPLACIFQSIPQSVLGGCTIMLFGEILMAGIKLISKVGLSKRNMTIAALSLSIGVGFTMNNKIFQFMPQMVQNVFGNNAVSIVFVVSAILNMLLLKGMEQKVPINQQK